MEKQKKIKIVLVSGVIGAGKDTTCNYLKEFYGFEKYSFADNLKDIAMNLHGLSHDEVYNNKQKCLLDKPFKIEDEYDKFCLNVIQDCLSSSNEETHSYSLELLDTDFPSKQKFWIDITSKFIFIEKEEKKFFQLFWTPRAILIMMGNIMRSVNKDVWVLKVCNDILKNKKTNLFCISDFRYPNECLAIENFFRSKNIDIDIETIRLKRFEDKSSSKDPSETALKKFKFSSKIDNSNIDENEFYKVLDLKFQSLKKIE